MSRKVRRQQTRKWNRNSWSAELVRRHGEGELAIWSKFDNWTQTHPEVEWRGSIARTDEQATFWPWLQISGVEYFPPACFRVDGMVELPYRHLGFVRPSHRNIITSPFQNEAWKDALRDKIAEIPGVSEWGISEFPLNTLADAVALSQFCSVLDWYIGELKMAARLITDRINSEYDD